MLTFPHPVDQSYFESLRYLMHVFIMVFITYCNNYLSPLILVFLRVFCHPLSLLFTHSLGNIIHAMASSITHKTDDFQICTSSPHLSPNLQIHNSSGYLDVQLDISTWLFKVPHVSVSKTEFIFSCIPSPFCKPIHLLLSGTTMY